MSKETAKHIEAVREVMRSVGVDAVIIPGTDPHQSEYISDYWKVRDWVSGFTGSNGTAVITLNEAALWTDSRYFLQAAEQLEGSGMVMHRENGPDPDTKEEWLVQVLADDAVIGIDGRLFSARQVSELEQFCFSNGFRLATDFAPADRVWTDRPARPSGKAMVHDIKYAGESVESKLSRIMERVEALGADSMLVTSLASIAWTLNLRGSDVTFTPVVTSFLYISEPETVLFIDDDKVTAEVSQHLKAAGVKVKDYDAVEKYLEKIRESVSVLVDPDEVNDSVASAIASKVYAKNPIAMLKGVKNEVEIEGFRRAMERDGAALVRTFMWVEKMAPTGTVTETDVARKAIEERRKEDLYTDESFGMIAGYAAQGAIVHYEPEDATAATLQGNGLLLIDTGGQYLDGTTDITRTISLGNPTEAERHDYTLVLKGHLALGNAVFPEHTRGVQLDVLARQFLWKEHLTYFHGTGHGVGHYLSVHEGPQSIRTQENPVELVPGMITSNEPGLYKTDCYGVRIENCVLTVADGSNGDFGGFMKFEDLTLFPYDLSLIDVNMLTAEERAQVNNYHRVVRERLSSRLSADELAWLEAKTKEI
ncbi:MAG: aminopeptidase P family protein [Muribaculaceae bacterium]